MERVEIYALYDPRNPVVRYIGKAKDSAKRLKTHLLDSRRRDTPVYRWIRILLSEGVTPHFAVVAVTIGPDWVDTEKAIISQWRAHNPLLNVAEGGNAPECPLEQRQANGRLAAVTRVSTPEKKRIYELKRNLGMALRKGWVSEASRAKLRLAAQRRPDLFACFANC